MSVLVVLKVPGDTATFESFVASNKERVIEVSERAKAGGCLAHRFAVGDGHIIVVDEWETPEQFETFFSAPDVQTMVGEMGARGEPEITFANPKGFPGEF